jgi:hypothetical protein
MKILEANYKSFGRTDAECYEKDIEVYHFRRLSLFYS